MTTKQDFSASEWELIVEGPPTAGLFVITAQHGGMVRETMSMAKAYVEARQQHGQSELLDEIVAAKPKVDHSRYRTREELREHALSHLRDAAALLQSKATPDELEQYRRFVVGLVERVAAAHREGHDADGPISDPERAAIDAVAQALG
jgi:hypothetical protein